MFIPSGSTGMRLPSGFEFEPPEGDAPPELVRSLEAELRVLFGMGRLTVLHTRDRRIADSEDFVAPIANANGVWIGPGNAGRLASIFLGTKTEATIRALLKRGGVVAGNSAGAIIQGDFVVRGRTDKPVLMAKGHDRGFGFLRNVVLNPHLTEAKREAELIQVVDLHPKLLGIGIDEKAAVVVKGDWAEVIGQGRVAIYDNTKHGKQWFFYLEPGARFNLRLRQQQSP